MSDIKWNTFGLVNEFDKDSDKIILKLDELYETILNKKIVVPPSIFYTLVVMIRDRISYGSPEWFVESFMEYYNKHPDVEGFDKEDHYNYGRIQFRIFDYLKWLENRRSLIL
jgi:hypothetical protein